MAEEGNAKECTSKESTSKERYTSGRHDQRKALKAGEKDRHEKAGMKGRHDALMNKTVKERLVI